MTSIRGLLKSLKALICEAAATPAWAQAIIKRTDQDMLFAAGKEDPSKMVTALSRAQHAFLKSVRQMQAGSRVAPEQKALLKQMTAHVAAFDVEANKIIKAGLAKEWGQEGAPASITQANRMDKHLRKLIKAGDRYVPTEEQMALQSYRAASELWMALADWRPSFTRYVKDALSQ